MPSDLEALVAAASPGPWRNEKGVLYASFSAGEQIIGQLIREDAELAALAPALAREVLDRRREGEVLDEIVNELQGHASTFDEPPSVHVHDLLHRADQARARWAKLREAEEEKT